MSRTGTPECGDHLDRFPCNKCAATVPAECAACPCSHHDKGRADRLALRDRLALQSPPAKVE